MASLSKEEQSLFDLACADRLDEAGRARLEAMLKDSGDSRQRYLDYCSMHGDLFGAVRLNRVRDRVIRAIEQDTVTVVGAPDEPKRPSNSSAGIGVALAIAATLLVAFVAIPRGGETIERASVIEDHQRWPRFVATVIRVEDAEWYANETTFEADDHLSRNQAMLLKSGLVEIEFRQGAVVVLEGPAHFVPQHANAATLLAGKLAAVAPPWATGFRIDTPGIDVVDLGTEFAVNVGGTPEEPQVNVSVTEGEVDVVSTDADEGVRRLVAGEGVRSVGQSVEEVDDAKTRRLTNSLPDRPELKGVVVVGDRWEDWIPGEENQPRSEGNWRYLANFEAPFGDPSGYVDLVWNSKKRGYLPPQKWRENLEYGFVRVHRAGGHPGKGAKQTDDDFDRYSITAFVVPEDGVYQIESGWLERYESKRWDLDEVLDVRFHVNDGPVRIQAVCNRSGFVAFRGSLGELKAGDVIYGGVGPHGVDFGDRFRWGYYVVREAEPTIRVASSPISAVKDTTDFSSDNSSLSVSSNHVSQQEPRQ